MSSSGRQTPAILNVQNYGAVGDGVTDDGPAIRAALAAAPYSATIYFPPVASGLSYRVASTVNITGNEITFMGSGVGSSLSNTSNIAILNVTGSGFQMKDMRVYTGDTARTVWPIEITGVRPIFKRMYFDSVSGARSSGIHFGGGSGSMGTVVNSIFNHCCIKVETWDVKIDKCYVWAMSNDYGIGLFSGVGNTTITNTDIVPPLQTTTTGLAGIYTSGACLNTKISNVYLDGNPSLDTRKGIYIGPSAGAVLIENVNANRMDDDVITIDSAYNVIINGYSGYSNNNQGRGSREIVVVKTGTQAVEKVRITNAQCLQTAAVSGTAAPAIYVDSAVDGTQVSIENFDIKQPGGGGGYSTPEISCDSTTTSLVGKGQLSKYAASGSTSFASGTSGVTITLSSPYPMAYQPQYSDITLAFDVAIPSYPRIQFNSSNQIYVSWSGTAAAAGNVYWKVSLKR